MLLVHHFLVFWFIAFLNWIRFLSIDKWLKFVQILVYVLGGIGAYVKWFYGRVYKGRLESNISSTTFRKNGYIGVNIAISVKNIGLTKVEIDREYTCLRLYRCATRTNVIEAASVHWDKIGRWEVFQHDSYIESAETTRDQILISVPEEDIDAFQIELSVYTKKNQWISKAVVVPEEKLKAPHRRIIT